MGLDELAYFMSKFVLEVRKKDGLEYPPNSLFQIVMGIQSYIKTVSKVNVEFLQSDVFEEFRQVLDGEMKRLTRNGLGQCVKKAEAISVDEEELLWRNGQLGDRNPRVLVNTLLYLNGKHFGLHGHEDAFYLQALQTPTDKCWYSRQPLGHNTLQKIVPEMCRKAGVQSYKTNHSLRVTTATHLYQAGVSEPLIMERTGHRSVTSVRSYTRTSEDQKAIVNAILNDEQLGDAGTSTETASWPDQEHGKATSATSSSVGSTNQAPD
ncbi:uncharacterized protein KIAA1958-like [Haliotis asinina]|uniref:uncharacterized protein KIAA1958-like n=1 Tax=Haliotis asinina TaxID=109174 RepID=UPI003531B8B3